MVPKFEKLFMPGQAYIYVCDCHYLCYKQFLYFLTICEVQSLVKSLYI